MKKRHPMQCVRCGKFVPDEWVSVMSVGDYGGFPYEDDTVCARHGGPHWNSEAGRRSEAGEQCSSQPS